MWCRVIMQWLRSQEFTVTERVSDEPVASKKLIRGEFADGVPYSWGGDIVW